jgi:hypothetical protein
MKGWHCFTLLYRLGDYMIWGLLNNLTYLQPCGFLQISSVHYMYDLHYTGLTHESMQSDKLFQEYAITSSSRPLESQ